MSIANSNQLMRRALQTMLLEENSAYIQIDPKE